MRRPRLRKRLVIAAVVVVALFAAGLASAWLVLRPSHSSGGLDTTLTGVTVTPVRPPPPPPPAPPPKKPHKPTVVVDDPCWLNFGGDPQRDARAGQDESRHPDEAALGPRAMGGYMEYPPSYCDGHALCEHVQRPDVRSRRARPGEMLWQRQGHAAEAVDAGDRGAAPDRQLEGRHGDRVRPQERGDRSGSCRRAPRSSRRPSRSTTPPTSGQPTGGCSRSTRGTGSVRWAYNTGGRINSSPSIWGNRICITTYAGSIFCLNRLNGHKLWSTLHHARLRPVRELLREPVDRREAAVHDLALGQGHRAACAERRHASGRTT